METPIITLVTYNELVTLINSNSLNPGLQYKITDYRTRHYIVDFEHNRYSGAGNEIIGELEPLIVTATSVNTIDKDAKSELYPMDIIYYDWDPNNWLNDLSFADADISSSVVISGFTGVIVFRYDTLLDNYFGYDFRNVKFRRWQTQTNAWNSGVTYNRNDIVNYNLKIYKAISGNITTQPDTNSNIWSTLLSLSSVTYWNSSPISTNNIPSSIVYSDFKTFVETTGATYESSCRSNHIESFKDSSDFNYATGSLLPNNVFFLDSSIEGVSIYSNSIGSEFCFNTLTNYCYYNVISAFFFNNMIGINFISNQIGNLVVSNIIRDNFVYNRIGNNFTTNIIGESCNSNDFSNRISFNIIGNGMLHNNIGSHFTYNTIGNGCSHNTISSEFSGNTIGNGFLMNHLGNNFSDNSIGNNFIYNHIANYFNLNAIGDDFNFNTIGNHFYNNIISTNFYYNTIESDFSNNSGIQSGFTLNAGSCSGIDFTSATHVYGNYSCTFLKTAGGLEKIQYIDALNTFITLPANS